MEQDEEVPADLLLLSAPKDIVFVSTMNLDGETNLKDREIPFNLEEEKLKTIAGKVSCEIANANLDYWEGQLKLD